MEQTSKDPLQEKIRRHSGRIGRLLNGFKGTGETNKHSLFQRKSSINSLKFYEKLIRKKMEIYRYSVLDKKEK